MRLAASRNLPPPQFPSISSSERPGKTTKLSDRLLKLAVTRNLRLTAKDLKNMYTNTWDPLNGIVNRSDTRM
ncbi:hypothetical protein Pcinc_033188 [Petrolisthes cinctipes]|uniref:Uncharacterized protein n=1 Tax=Petrolisthes cinctipes TaxID=88211 RepID=A0AAE1JXW7_PETCI|nr:hypothetical protein Pcinc_033188 [Petrolisthes cinctipes]